MEEDMILPDDYVDTQPQDNAEPEDTFEPEEEAPTEPVAEDTKPEEEQPTPQKLKIKFNHEEREIDLEEAAALAQKGMNYDKAVERASQEAAQKARDSLIADMGYTWNGKAITTEAEYKQAMAEQKIIEQYKDRDLPDEVIQELLESRRDREERKREKAEKEAEEKQLASFNEFFDYFKDVNERAFDPQKDTIPPEVKAAVDKGESLKHAYMEYHNKELRNRLKVEAQNKENQRKAPVTGVTTNGGTKTEPEDPFLAGFNSI